MVKNHLRILGRKKMDKKIKKQEEPFEKTYVKEENFTPEEKGLYDKYNTKIKKWIYASAVGAGIFTAASSTDVFLSTRLPKPTPIIRKYEQINSALQFLYFERAKINENFDLPYINPEIRKELSGFLGNKEMKIKGLDNAIKLAQRDSADVYNTKEFRDHGDKLQKFTKYATLTLGGSIGLFLLPFGFVFYYLYKQEEIRHRKIPKKS